MEEKILQKLEEQEKKINAIYKSVESARKIFLATLIITIVTFVLPLIGLIFILPWAMGVLGNAYSGLL
ncbi:MAG: hypothetical protein WC819_03365 [Parcubacteria group bacterium]|jgi:hypothetical protein